MKQKLAILGSTGSIGTQTLDVVRENSDKFEVYAITANNNIELLIAQAREFQPEFVVIANENLYPQLKDALADLPLKVFAGHESIADVASMNEIDVVITAMVGYSGLLPTIAAVKAGKKIGLANKETLVVAGELITKLAIENKSAIIPVDSEHSAIFQSLCGEGNNEIEKVILTASGGPFRNTPLDQLKDVKAMHALKHPNWDMGAKITIDSATLMNKGFEVIEAKWLFGLKPEQIEVVVHQQSIIHSLVQFTDSSVKAQLGLPDMKLPIQYALSYPHRFKNNFPRLDLVKCASLTFENPDTTRFRNLALAYKSMEIGGNVPCILNAANEIMVAEYLKDNVGFLEMSDIMEEAMEQVTFIKSPTYEDYVETDKAARLFATERLKARA